MSVIPQFYFIFFPHPAPPYISILNGSSNGESLPGKDKIHQCFCCCFT